MSYRPPLNNEVSSGGAPFSTMCRRLLALGQVTHKESTNALMLKKAFDFISHDYARTHFADMLIRPQLVNLMMSVFTAPICLVMQGELRSHHCMDAELGVSQGCPLSPFIFATLISPLSQNFFAISLHVQVNCMPMIFFLLSLAPKQHCTHSFYCVAVQYQHFSVFLGFPLTMQIELLYLRARGRKLTHYSCLLATKFNVKDPYKYLGIHFGKI